MLGCSASHVLGMDMLISFLRIMISSAVHAEHAPLYDISNCMSSMLASSLKVRLSKPPNSSTLRALVCSCACLRAALARGLLPSASSKKVTIRRAPPARSSPRSQTQSEPAVHFYLGDKVDPNRERRHQSAVARSCGDMVISTTQRGGARLRAAGATVGCVRIVAAYRRWYRSVLPMDSVHARGGIENR